MKIIQTLLATIALSALPLHATIAQPDDKEQRIAALRTAMKAGMTRGTCVPPQQAYYGSKAETTPLTYDLLLSAQGSDLLLCAMLDTRELVACWKHDARTGQLAASAAILVPGYSVTGNSCRQFGYCRAGATGTDTPVISSGGDLVTASLDGGHVAVVDQDAGQVAVFDAASKNYLRAFAYRGEKLGIKGVRNMPVRAFYLADTLFILGSDAGPFSTIHRYSTRGTRGNALGPFYRQGTRLFNVFDGEIRIRDNTHLVAHDRGYLEITLNAATGDTRVNRLPRPAACTPKQFNAAAQHLSGYDTADPDEYAEKEIGAACITAIMQAKKRYWKPTTFVHQGLSYEISDDGKARQLISRSLATGAITRAMVSATCAVGER